MSKQKWMMTFAVAVLLPGYLAAQEKDPRLNPPVQPVGVESSSKAPGAATPAPVQTTTIEKEPLSGASWLGLGFLGGARSYLQPSFSLSQNADLETAGPNVWRSQTQINAGLKLRREWQSYLVDLDYSLGGLAYASGQNQTSLVQAVNLGQQISRRRWTISMRDAFSYLPESSYGTPLLGNLNGNGLGSNLLNGNPLYNPTQTLLTGGGSRISNMVSGQVQYDVNRQLAFTGSTSYSIFRFLNNSQNLFETNTLSVQGGVNYALNRFDTLAVTYSIQQTRFKGQTGGFDSQVVQLNYAHRINGRMSFQVGAGPDFRTFDFPGRPKDTRTSWSARTRFLYSLRNMDMGLSYSHSSTNGSGVLLGASTDSIEGSVSRKLFRDWSSSFSGGYARNESFAQTAVGTNQARFGTWKANAIVGRRIGRSVQLNGVYTFQSQEQTLCGATTLCLANTRRHVFGITFSWLFRQIELN